MSEYTGVMKTSSSLIVKFVIMLEKGEEESYTLLLNGSCRLIFSLVMSISKFLKIHQKTIRVQLRKGPHFVLFILCVCHHGNSLSGLQT